MGSYISCISTSPPVTTYDMSPVRNKNLPFIWITGAPNSGKKTIGRLIRNKYEFEYINITDLLRQEATKDTKEAAIIKKYLNVNRKVPDEIVLSLLKQSLLNSTNDKGYLISNFPKTIKQAEAFTRDIANVNFVFYLYTGFPLLIDRAQRKSTTPLDSDVLRRNIANCTREIKACLGKFAVKIESINTNGLPEETFPKVETALIRRINIARPIIAETDYVQVQQVQQADQRPNAVIIENTQGKEETQNVLNQEQVEAKVEELQLTFEGATEEIINETIQEKESLVKKNENKDINSTKKISDDKDDTEKELDDLKRDTDIEETEIKLTEFNQEALTAEDNIVPLDRN